MSKRRKKPDLEEALAALFENLEILPDALAVTTGEGTAAVQTVLKNSLAEVSRAAAPQRQYRSGGTFNPLEAAGTADAPQSERDDRQLSVLTDIKALIERRDPNYL